MPHIIKNDIQMALFFHEGQRVKVGDANMYVIEDTRDNYYLCVPADSNDNPFQSDKVRLVSKGLYKVHESMII